MIQYTDSSNVDLWESLGSDAMIHRIDSTRVWVFDKLVGSKCVVARTFDSRVSTLDESVVGLDWTKCVVPLIGAGVFIVEASGSG